ncbi:MAG TPA: glycosyltransferase [Acidimicrobiia bacterium]|nr:glycosyltransferase [Acidimicrobiia bacterium]
MTATAPSPTPGPAPLVSVIIPAYNMVDFVAETIESALAQTYSAVEIIVVNDGSTDETAAAIAPYRDRIRYVEQENRGLAGARNTGIRVSRGEYLALLDADDLWLPDRLGHCVEHFAAHPHLGMVTTDAYLIEGGETTTKRCYRDRRQYPFPDAEDHQLAVIARRNFLFVSVVFKRELVDRYGSFDEQFRRAEDYELWSRYLVRGERAGYVDEPLGYYRRRADSLSASPEQWRAHLAVKERHLPDLWEQGVEGRPRDLMEIGRDAAARGDRRTARRFFGRAIRAADAPWSTRARYAASAARSLVSPRRSDGSLGD